MEENKPNETRKEETKGNKLKPSRRTASSNGRESSQTGDETQPARCSSWSKTVPDPKFNCTNQRSARGDEQMDADDQQISEMGPEITRKRKSNSQAQIIVEKKARSESELALSFSELSKEKCASFEEQNDLDHLTVFNSGRVEETKRCRRYPKQAFHVLSASTSGGKPTTSDTKPTATDTFSEPFAREQAPLENGYFGQGAKLKDGTLRPPPEDTNQRPGHCTGCPSIPKESKTEKTKEDAKDWTPGNKEPTPESKKETVPEVDSKTKKVPNNTDRYLNMF